MAKSKLWDSERMKALQLSLALRVYSSEYGFFPENLDELLEKLKTDFDLTNHIKKSLKFRDPKTKLESDWLYRSNAIDGSPDLLLASPYSHLKVQLQTKTGNGLRYAFLKW